MSALVATDEITTDAQAGQLNQPLADTLPTTEPQPATYDVIVIGGGPAGMSACIYLARKKLKTLLISKDLGGQATQSNDIDNYLGYSMISGRDLTRHFQQHLDEFRDTITLKLVNHDIRQVSQSGQNFAVQLGDGSTEVSRSVIIASGRVPRHLGIPGEKEFLNRGVTFCAWCDGPLFRGKSIAVIGGGNAALDAVIATAKIVKNVTIINLAEQLTADEVYVDRVLSDPAVRVMNNTRLVRIVGDRFVTGVLVQDQATGKERELPVSGVFIEIGSLPSTEYVKGLVRLNQTGEIVIDNRNMSSVEGIFAAGDVTDVVEKQIIVAAGEGSKAGIQCAKWLAGR